LGPARLRQGVGRLNAHFSMNASDISTLRELVGPWTRLVLAAGFAGACVSYFAQKLRPRAGVTLPKVAAWMALGMFMLGVLIVFLVLPLSSAYSGPVPSNIRHLRDYDKYLATLAALVFAAAFAVEVFRSRRTAK
jgi:hypothetical protein